MAKSKNIVVDRVLEYMDSPRMRQRVKAGRALSCVVDGNYGTYSTRAGAGPKWHKQADCTCPSDYWPCKHANALVATYQQAPDTFVDVDRLLADLGSKPAKQLLLLMREMILAAPASLHALRGRGLRRQR